MIYETIFIQSGKSIYLVPEVVYWHKIYKHQIFSIRYQARDSDLALWKHSSAEENKDIDRNKIMLLKDTLDPNRELSVNIPAILVTGRLIIHLTFRLI